MSTYTFMDGLDAVPLVARYALSYYSRVEDLGLPCEGISLKGAITKVNALEAKEVQLRKSLLDGNHR